MKRAKYVIRAAALALIAALLVGCGRTGKSEADSTGKPVQKTAPAITDVINLSGKPGFGKAGQAYIPVDTAPSVPDYAINPDLSNIVNLDQFPNLTAEQKAKLAVNGFVVAAGTQEQLFYIYEDNTYKKIPNFVTTDSVLQVYHILYDYSLRSVENASLLPMAVELNKNMLTQLQKEYNAITDPEIKAEALKVLGYFGVAQLAFGATLPADFPEEVKALADSEIKLINAAEEKQNSPLFGYIIDYSLMTPRGHYTRTEEFKKYFKGMSWYGIVPLYAEDDEAQCAMRSIITATALYRLPEAEGSALWESIYSTTSFFVGSADDLTPYQIAEIVQKVYGNGPDMNGISDPEKLDRFIKEFEALSKPQINHKSDTPAGRQLRFMGQRYIPDSEILQELCDWPERPFPTGLDVFASLGSRRAADIIAEVYRPAETWPEYTKEFERMREKFTTLPDSAWQSNMYYAWLWTQYSLTGDYGTGYPMFMRNTAWQDKSLTTALASWAEMRHDTILYAKASGAEGGGFQEPPPVVRAYVEPNAELYNRLLWLTTYSKENLSARGILPLNIEETYGSFENMLAFLRDCSIKELKGEDLTAEEYDRLLTYGGILEHMTARSTEDGYEWYQIESETDRNMGVIADVHTVSGRYLEEAVGAAAEIYVVVPMGGELYITRGATFDYFEFVSGERLTDEKWQAMIRNNLPERPPFTKSFIAGKAQEVPVPLQPYIPEGW